MGFSVFLRQLFRAKGRAMLSILLLCAVTSFFVMSVNLYQSSVLNLDQVENQYETVAYLEFGGNINRYGKLVDPGAEDSIGYRTVAREDFDLTPILESAYVTGYDLRERCGAYIPGEIAMSNAKDAFRQTLTATMTQCYDVIRFHILSDEPIVLGSDSLDGRIVFIQDVQYIPMEILESSFPNLHYTERLYVGATKQLWAKRYQTVGGLAYGPEQVAYLSRGASDEQIVLYPDTEYLAVSCWNGWVKSDQTGKYVPRKDDFYQSKVGFNTYRPDFGAEPTSLFYAPTGSILNAFDILQPDGSHKTSEPLAEQPFPLQFYEDVQLDPALAAYFQQVAELARYNACSYITVLTDDIEGMAYFQMSDAELKEGRLITPEEYASGAKVCVISDTLAKVQGWALGDHLDMNLWRYDMLPYYEIPDTDSGGYGWYETPRYTPQTEGFFDTGEYEIVGIYQRGRASRSSEMDPSTVYLPWSAILIPKNSAPHRPDSGEVPIHGSLLTLRLKNGSAGAFLEEMAEKGVTGEKPGEYETSFVIHDHGYSAIQPGLTVMRDTARLLLILSSALLAATVILLAYFFAQSQKHSVGIFRMLGGGKASAFAAVLACGLALAVLGAAFGAVLGHTLSQGVGTRILSENLRQSREAAEFSAYLLAGGEKEVVLSAGADGRLTLASAAAGAGLFLIFTIIFVLVYLKKEPRALLPGNE